MGTWGYGPLDNDTAADLVSFVVEAGPKGWSLVRKALRSGYEQELIGAAELVALALGTGTRQDKRAADLAVMRHTAMPWVRQYGRAMPADLPALALDAARVVLAFASKRKPKSQRERTLAGMKLINVFVDEGDGPRQWQSTLRSLIRRLERGSRRRRS